jgi:hypothetical protein
MKTTSKGSDALRIRRALLASFDEDVPASGAKDLAMAALGVALGPAAASSAASGALAQSKATSGSAASLTASAAPKVGAIVALKWFGLGLLGGAAVMVPTRFYDGGRDRKEAAAPPAVAVREAPRPPTFAVAASPERHAIESEEPVGELAPGPSIAASSGEADRHGPSPSAAKTVPTNAVREATRAQQDDRMTSPLVSDRATVPTAPRGSAPLGSTMDPTEARPKSSTPTLGAEIEWLDAARRALSEGNAPHALALLNRYARDFSQGAMRPEADVLRVQALIQAQRREEAARLAQELTGTLPDRYVEKIRALLEQSPRPR